MKLKKILITVLLLLPMNFVYADTGQASQFWGTAKWYHDGLTVYTAVQTNSNDNLYLAGARSSIENAGMPSYSTTTTTAWATSWIIKSYEDQAHYHDYYGGYNYRSINSLTYYRVSEN